MRYFTWFRPEQHDFEYAERAIKAGLDGFEAVYRESYLGPEIQQEYLKDLQRIKVDLGASFTVHAPSHDVNLGSLNVRTREAAFEEIKASIDFARSIGASIVVVHPVFGILGMPEGKWSKEYHPPKREAENLSRQEALLVRAVKDLADYAPDVMLCLENLVYPHEIYRSSEDMAELIRKINRSNVGITLDVGHATVCGHKPADFLNLLQDDVFHVHLHDNDGVIDQHLPLGEGIIDYVEVLDSLKSMGYQGVVTFEFMLEDPGSYRKYVQQSR
ncbi:MAG TPA: sugar phosphate isomerase/epimerase family protein [Limnochordia bacterium]|nr:sugar phosphate isomerase/epimerase family protein [Limnochordia bacterium]